MPYLTAIVKLLGGWRSTVFAVLAVAALVTCLIFWGRLGDARVRANAAQSRAEKAESDLLAVRQAQVRDALSDTATQIAIGRMDDAAAETNTRLANLERRINGRPPVPAVCPEPDPVLLRESGEGADRFRSSLGELRRLRGSEGQPARKP
jgi:hypothetical protein